MRLTWINSQLFKQLKYAENIKSTNHGERGGFNVEYPNQFLYENQFAQSKTFD